MGATAFVAVGSDPNVITAAVGKAFALVFKFPAIFQELFPPGWNLWKVQLFGGD
jgi:hypothetical protein